MESPLAERSLAILIVLSLCLMSLGADACQAAAVLNGSCADESSAPSQAGTSNPDPMAMAGNAANSLRAARDTEMAASGGIFCRNDRSCADEFCVDATTSAMLPAGTAVPQGVSCAAAGVLPAANWQGNLSFAGAVSSPPRIEASPHLLSPNLRI